MNNRLKKNRENLVVFFKVVFCALFASLLATQSHELFKDRSNYLVYLTSSDLIISRYIENGGLTAFLANEPVFLYLNVLLKTVLGFFDIKAEEILRLYVFFNAFVISLFVMSSRRSFLGAILVFLFLLSSPFSFSMFNVSLRQSLALSFLIVGLYYGLRVFSKKGLFVLFLLGFIHNAFFIIFFSVFVFYSLSKFKSGTFNFKLIVVSLLLSMMPLFLRITQSASDFRHSSYLTSSVEVSGFVFFMFLLVFTAVIYMYRKYQSNYDSLNMNYFIMLVFIMIVYFSLYWFIPAAGRYVNIFLPLLIYFIFYKFNLISKLIIILVFCFNLMVLLPKGYGFIQGTIIDDFPTLFAYIFGLI